MPANRNDIATPSHISGPSDSCRDLLLLNLLLGEEDQTQRHRRHPT